jgi:hypothetical protein
MRLGPRDDFGRESYKLKWFAGGRDVQFMQGAVHDRSL